MKESIFRVLSKIKGEKMKKLFYVVFICVGLLFAKQVEIDGKNVEIPNKIEKISPTIGAFTQMAAMLGASDRIEVIAPVTPEFMYEVFPKLKRTNNKSGMLANSVESIIASKTQIVFGPLKITYDDNQIKQLSDARVVVINMDKFNTPDEIMQTVGDIATIIGNDAPKIANKFNKYFKNNINFVQNKTQNLKDKKSVLVLNVSGGNLTTIGETDIGTRYIEMAGGINLSAVDNKGDFKRVRIISDEQVLIYNPDFIITNTPKSQKEIMQNPAFASLKAVKTKNVKVIPQGVYLWSVRSAEGALQPLWLGKILYPNLFKELNLKNEVKKFYNEFYGYKLNDKQVNEILRDNFN